MDPGPGSRRARSDLPGFRCRLAFLAPRRRPYRDHVPPPRRPPLPELDPRTAPAAARLARPAPRPARRPLRARRRRPAHVPPFRPERRRHRPGHAQRGDPLDLFRRWARPLRPDRLGEPDLLLQRRRVPVLPRRRQGHAAVEVPRRAERPPRPRERAGDFDLARPRRPRDRRRRRLLRRGHLALHGHLHPRARREDGVGRLDERGRRLALHAAAAQRRLLRGHRAAGPHGRLGRQAARDRRPLRPRLLRPEDRQARLLQVRGEWPPRRRRRRVDRRPLLRGRPGLRPRNRPLRRRVQPPARPGSRRGLLHRENEGSPRRQDADDDDDGVRRPQGRQVHEGAVEAARGPTRWSTPRSPACSARGTGSMRAARAG